MNKLLTIFFLGSLPLAALDSVVVFNEVHYHPAGDQSTLEYVELYNQLSVDVDLSNWKIDGDISFDFPEGTVLGGGAYLVIAKDPAALSSATGHGSALGPYEGLLSNSGRPVILYNNNRSFSAVPPSTPGVPPEKLWSVDLQGDGNGGLFGQLSPPDLMSGVAGESGLGGVWNAFTIAGHSGVSTDPSMNLVDSAGAASGVGFSIDGTVTGWSQEGDALVADYLFVNAGNADSSITWQISGLTPGERYTFLGHGGISRDISLTLDRDGDGSLAGESSFLVGSAGLSIDNVLAGDTGVIMGRASRGSVEQGNWGGFQLVEQATFEAPPRGVPHPGLEARRIMDRLDFSDSGRWPWGPDGSGFTLAKVDPGTASGPPENWSVSGQLNGSPGIGNTFVASSSLAFNEVSPVGAATFQIEIHNFGSSPVSLGDFVIASSVPRQNDFVLPATFLAPGGFEVINALSLGFTPADNNRLFLYTAGKSQLIDTIRADDSAQARFPDGSGPWLRPDLATFGSANQVTFEEDVVINEIFYHAYPQRSSPGSPPGLFDLQVLDFDGMWRYNLDGGSAGLPSDWAATAHPADGVQWRQGRGLLGRETSALAHPLNTTLSLSSKTTYYFETEFTYLGTETVEEMILEHLTDDSAVIYLNGLEVARYNISADPLLASSPADQGIGNAELQTLTIAGPNVVVGTNRISVEVHQNAPSSSDLVWGSRVTLRVSDGTAIPSTPYARRDEEWIELYNRGASAMDLGNWSMAGGISYDFPPGTTLGAGEYLVLAKNAMDLGAKYPGVRVMGDFSGKLSNRGEAIILRNARTNPVDQVHYYDGGKWHAAADGGGSSLELRDAASDNSLAGAWAPSDESPRSDWQTFTYEGVAVNDGIGNNVYHEFLIALLDAGEFLLDDVSVVEDGALELIQNGDFENDSPGAKADKWRALGTHGSHDRTVVVADPEDPGNQCLHVVATGPTEDKHNKVETTFASNERVVPGRTYLISFRAKWLTGSNQINTRLYFNFLQKTHLLPVPREWGTPGVLNSNATPNLGPTLDHLAHSPVIPNSGQAAGVTVVVNDPDGVAEVTLFYSVDDGAFQSTAMTTGGAGIYSGTIPGQSGGRSVRFYARAADSAAASSLYPAAGPNGGAFYKVQDGLADSSGVRGNFRIVMSESERLFLFDHTNRMSNDRFPVTVIENEETVYYDVGLRLKASAFGRFNRGHYGFNIRFQPDQLFRGIHETVSVERSPNLKEILAKHLMNRAGGSYASFYDDVAHIITPTTGDRGIGLLSMTRHTGTFFDGLFPDSDGTGTLFNQELLYNPNGTEGGPEGFKIGNPYNHNNGRYDLEDRGLDKEPYRWGFQIRSARGRDDYSRLIALNQAMELNGTELQAALADLIDLDQWMRTFAMMSLNGTDDIYSRIWEHNFRYYVRPDDQKIIILQWDLDRSFQLGTTSSVTPSRNAVTKLFNIPSYRRRFDGHLKDLIETTFNSDYTTSWASHFSALTGDGMTGLPGYISGRAGHIENSLPSEIPFRITSNGGNDFSLANSTVELSGDGWIDVFTITANGLPFEVTWSDADSWRITVPVSIGPNPLTLRAFNNQGLEVGSDSITVTNTGSVALASADNTIIRELHYHPVEASAAEMAAGFTDSESFEFIEILNTSEVNDIDLSRAGFTDGIDFIFSQGTILAPGARLVIVANRAAFEFRYGSGLATIAGEYAGQLRNSGERVRFEAADTSAIADFVYGDDLPWPESADGSGYSLVFAGLDPKAASAWRSSVELGGTPGNDDGRAFTGSEGLMAYALRSPLEPLVVGNFPQVSFLLNLANDEALVVVEYSTNLIDWVPLASENLRSRVNLGDGTSRVTYQLPLGFSSEPRQLARLRVIRR